jgi:valyl-tRNA synthetase
MARLDSIQVAAKIDLPGAFHDAIGGVGLLVLLPVQELGDAERAKLAKELAGVAKEEAALRLKLADEAFLSRAPAAVVEKNKGLLLELEARRKKLASNLGKPEEAPGA